jgi:hypothetical protein
MWPRTFREGFCKECACATEAFETTVFWRCLHRRALPLSALIYRLHPSFFDPDFHTIRCLGNSTSYEEFGQEVNSFRSDNRRRGGFLRRKLRVRVSGRRLMKLLLVLPTDMPGLGRSGKLSDTDGGT